MEGDARLIGRMGPDAPFMSISLSLSSGSKIVSIWTFLPKLLTARAMALPLSPTGLSIFKQRSESLLAPRRLSICCGNMVQCAMSTRSSLHAG